MAETTKRKNRIYKDKFEATTKKQPYRELGESLHDLRRKKFRSALSFFNAEKRSFSYRCYVEYERGESLPPIETYLEIVNALDAIRNDAVFAWVQAQMPTSELKAIFDPQKQNHHSKATSPILQNSGAGESLENTWVFNAKDRELMSSFPALWEFCQILSMNYPAPVFWRNMGFETENKIRTFCETYLTRWQADARLDWTGFQPQDTVKIQYQQIYIPKSQEWLAIRERNGNVAFSSLLHSWMEFKKNASPSALAGQIPITALAFNIFFSIISSKNSLASAYNFFAASPCSPSLKICG